MSSLSFAQFQALSEADRAKYFADRAAADAAAKAEARKPVALAEYRSLLPQVGQAKFDRWPEARAMARRLYELATEAGISVEQVDKDLAAAPVCRDGGRC